MIWLYSLSTYGTIGHIIADMDKEWIATWRNNSENICMESARQLRERWKLHPIPGIIAHELSIYDGALLTIEKLSR